MKLKRLVPVIVKEKIKTYRRELFHAARSRNVAYSNLPDFIIIGSQKCGTTSLYDYLVQHPKIESALTKEVHYFDLNFTKSIKWYQAFFPKTGTLTGEATPYYMHYPHSMSRIAATLPDVKLFILLRNPVDRAYSSYQHQIWKRRETLSFEQAIDNEQDRIAGEFEKLSKDESYYSLNHHHFSYLDRGIYHEQIQRCYDHFATENVMIIDSAEFYSNTERIYGDALKFLNLEPHQLTEYRNVALRGYPKMSEATRQRLVEYYRPHNQRLYELLNRQFEWDR